MTDLKEIELDGLTDFQLEVDALIDTLTVIKYKHGGKSVIRVDAGHNNVQVFLKPDREDG